MVIRMRHTRSHTKNRRSHHALKAPALSKCPNCGAMHRPHHMCLECGYYKGRMVIDVQAQKDKRAARLKAKEEMIKGQQAAMQDEVADAVNETEGIDTDPAPAKEEK